MKIILLIFLIGTLAQAAPFDSAIREAQENPNPDQALKKLEEIRRQYPEASLAHFLAAQLYYEMRGYPKAADAVKDLFRSLKSAQEKGHYLARLRSILFRFRSAQEKSFFYQGNRLLRQNQITEAIPFFYQALDQNPANPQTLLRLALAFQKQGDLTEAIRYLEEARRYFPVLPEILGELKFLYLERGDTEKLKILVREIQDFHGKTPFLDYDLGLAYLKKSQWQEARKVFETLVIETPDFPLSYFRLGQIAFQIENQKDVAKKNLLLFLEKIKKSPYDETLQRFFDLGLLEKSARQWLSELSAEH